MPLKLAYEACDLHPNLWPHFMALAVNESGGYLGLGLPSNVGGGAAAWGVAQFNQMAWDHYFKNAAINVPDYIPPKPYGWPSTQETATVFAEVGLTTYVYVRKVKEYSRYNQDDNILGLAMRVYHRVPAILNRIIQRTGSLDESTLLQADSDFSRIKNIHYRQLNEAIRVM
jgi:hypothetical protein